MEKFQSELSLVKEDAESSQKELRHSVQMKKGTYM